MCTPNLEGKTHVTIPAALSLKVIQQAVLFCLQNLSSATIIRQDEFCHPPVHGLHFRIVANSAYRVLRWCDKRFRFTLKVSLFADLRRNQVIALLLRCRAKLHGVSGLLHTCYRAHVCSCPTIRINLGAVRSALSCDLSL